MGRMGAVALLDVFRSGSLHECLGARANNRLRTNAIQFVRKDNATVHTHALIRVSTCSTHIYHVHAQTQNCGLQLAPTDRKCET